MEYIYLKGNAERTIVLLHGTGGDEHDLIPLSKHLDEDAHVLSFRGRVVEGGMNRFFKRISPGVFDMESLKNESDFLHNFILESVEKHALKHTKITLLGYSNGANIGLNLILNYPSIFDNAILLKPVPISNEIKNKNLSINVFIGAGENDPLTTLKNTNKVFESVLLAGAKAEIHYYNSGHSISSEELSDVKMWLSKLK